MICTWCYQPLAATDRITDHLDNDVHMDCAMTAVGMGVTRDGVEYQQWLGMTGEEIGR